jgi:SAM-dependent methyltransferase
MDREDWNRRYSQKELVWTAQANRFLVEEASGLPAGRALDLAAGEGRNAVWLAEHGWRALAVDFSDVALEKCKALAAQRKVSVDVAVADVTSYEPEPRGFDLVIVFYLQLPFDELRPVLARAAAAVADGGTFLLVAHDSSNLEHGHGGPPDPRVLYTAGQVVAAIGPDWVVEKASTVERPVETDTGTAVALDCLVRARRPARG